MNTPTISPAGLRELWQAGATIDLIDVRTPIEFRELHIEFARNVPLDELDPTKLMGVNGGSRDQHVYVICRSGNRGRQACENFLKTGFSNVINVEGGTLACESAGLPIVRGRKSVSLERQVRIAAGSLVLLGALLAWLVHPAFIAIPLFIGAGLIFAGATDTCGMGMLLARMPWNKCTDMKDSCSVT